MEKYEVMCLVGEGSFGKVYKAKERQTNNTVAFKVIRKRGRSEKELQSLRQECEIQRHLHHPNIIQMLDSFETENEIVVVTEYADKELYELLEKEGYLSEDRVQKIVCDLLSALYYLHSHRVLHRDLKPQNILMETSGVAKLCDFGFARTMSTGTYVLTSIKGTPLYMAPELIEERPYDHAADLWSLGCIVYELLVGSPPFCTSSILQLVRLIRHEEVRWPDFVSPLCRSFVQGLLQKDPNLRMTWPQLLEHPFVKHNIVIFKEEGIPTPLTSALTSSQAIAKEIQKQDLVNRTAGQSKILTCAIQKIEDQERRLKLLHEQAESSSSTHGRRGSSSAKTSIQAVAGDEPSPCRHSESSSCTSSNQAQLSGSCHNHADSKSVTEPSTRRSPCCEHKTSRSAEHSCCVTECCARNTSDSKASGARPKAKYLNAVPHDNTICINRSIGQKALEDSLAEVDELLAQLEDLKLVKDSQSHSDSNKAVTKQSQNTTNRSRDVSKSKGKSLKGECHQHVQVSKADCQSWQIAEDNQPIENEEWLAFLTSSMEEVMDGEVDSMRQTSFVSIVVSPLRNPQVSCRVVEYVACLLSLPFVAEVSEEDLTIIKQVYLEVKVVPHLVYGAQLMARRRGSEPSADELQALESLCLLLCNLVHAADTFLLQLCDALVLLGAVPIFGELLLLGRRKPRVVIDMLAVLSHILRVLPENASLVEHITFGTEGAESTAVDLCQLLTHTSPDVKARTCDLLYFLGQFSCRAVQARWSKETRDSLEALLRDRKRFVRRAAEKAISELKTSLVFYNQKDGAQY